MADDFVKQINAEKENEDKLAKMDELKEEYEEYAATITTTAVDQSTVTTTTTTTAAASGSSNTTTTTTEPVEKTDAQKASEALNEKIFSGNMTSYTAEKYQYDDHTIYVILKADIEDRMTDDDMWTDDIKDQLISQRYFQNFADWIEEIANGYSVDKNKSAYKRYEPFKLELEIDSE